MEITDDSFLLLINAHHENLDFSLPKPPEGAWQPVLDTNLPYFEFPIDPQHHLYSYLLAPRSLVLLISPLIKQK